MPQDLVARHGLHPPLHRLHPPSDITLPLTVPSAFDRRRPCLSDSEDASLLRLQAPLTKSASLNQIHDAAAFAPAPIGVDLRQRRPPKTSAATFEHSGQSPLTGSGGSSLLRYPGTHQCQVCGAVFVTLRGLQDHLKDSRCTYRHWKEHGLSDYEGMPGHQPFFLFARQIERISL